MKIKELLRGVDALELHISEDAEITGISCDSRQVRPGDLFVAVSGYATDGNRYIPMAMERGAVAVVTAHRPREATPYILVENDRLAMALLGCNFYGRPAEAMTVVGITGTNGKTSVTWLLKQVLEGVKGCKVGLIGTLEYHLGAQVVESQRTTPQSLELQALVAQMRDNGCRYCVMEVSSHALDQERVGGIRFDVAAFTNLTEDHLDYHKTMARYCDAKATLFARCDRAVVNGDDGWCDRLLAECRAPVLRCSLEGRGELLAEDVELHSDGVRFTARCAEQTARIQVPIPGRFTVCNVLTVLGVALQLGISLEAAAGVLKTVSGVKGRVEVVPTPGKPYTVLIDYAHTPDGLEKVLTTARGFCKGRVIAVFGCGGDRDPIKRPIMGGIGVRLADMAILTSDNPRTEDPMAILSDILRGVQGAKNYIVIENRVKAIQYAMDIGEINDIIVLAGKGHETYQEIMGVRQPLDEREVVAAYLSETR